MTSMPQTQTTDPAKRTHANGQLGLFLIAMFFVEASRSMTTVQVPVYLRELGADIRQIGLFFTLSLIFPLLLRVFGGWVSDSIGRLKAMLIGSLAGVLTYVAFAVSASWEMAVLAPALLAVATALTIPSYYAYIADHTSDTNRGRVYGLAETARTLAWIFSPPIGGMIGQRLGYRWMFAAAALTAALAGLVFLAVQRSTRLQQTAPQAKADLASLRSSLGKMFALAISGGLITWLLVADGIRDSAMRLSFDLMPVYLTDIAALTKQQIGLLDGIFGIAWVATSYPAGWLVDKTSARLCIVLGTLIQLASQVVFVLAASFQGFAASWILLGLGGALLEPAFSSLVARGVPKEVRGIVYGLLATSLGLLTLPFPWIGGQLWVLLGPRAPFLITVALGSLAILPAWRKLVVPPGEGTAEARAEG
jgi:DHA1 family multidrug resistance protein-like MFS transporter